ncbi:Ced12-like protein [Cryptosporidium canis]|uniref:Ced12-like protein n=1 Tax=Cryptosporidium canis TaxID=195482 RepID=A0A9D5HWW0_9CRYT|nr:Ced12-like protein [Cryptosporidium canis]
MIQPDTDQRKGSATFQNTTAKNSFIPDVVNLRDDHVDSQFKEALREKLREKSRKTICNRMKVTIIDKLCRLSKERKMLYYIRNRCLISLDCTDPNHERLFQDYWALAYPEYPEINRISSNWRLLGFQSDDPRFDFKCAGLVTLENLVYFAENYRPVFREILKESQRLFWSEETEYIRQNNIQTSVINSNSICVMTPSGALHNIQPSSSNISVTSTPINTKGSLRKFSYNFEPLLPKITESKSTISELSNNSQINRANVSYPLSAVLINISIMICLYLNLIPNAYKIPGIPTMSASRKAMRNFIRLTYEFPFNALSELFSVCAIRFHTEWLEIVKFVGHKGAISEFDKVLKNVQLALAETIESLPKDIIEFRQICNLEKYY